MTLIECHRALTELTEPVARVSEIMVVWHSINLIIIIIFDLPGSKVRTSYSSHNNTSLIKFA